MTAHAPTARAARQLQLRDGRLETLEEVPHRRFVVELGPLAAAAAAHAEGRLGAMGEVVAGPPSRGLQIRIPASSRAELLRAALDLGLAVDSVVEDRS